MFSLAGFELKTIDFHSDALTNLTIRPWVSLAHRVNFCIAFVLQYHFLFSAHISVLLSPCSLLYLQQTKSSINHISGVEWVYNCIHSWSWPKWDSNPQPNWFINWPTELSGHDEFDVPWKTTLYICSDVTLQSLPLSVPTFKAQWRYS